MYVHVTVSLVVALRKLTSVLYLNLGRLPDSQLQSTIFRQSWRAIGVADAERPSDDGLSRAASVTFAI